MIGDDDQSWTEVTKTVKPLKKVKNKVTPTPPKKVRVQERFNEPPVLTVSGVKNTSPAPTQTIRQLKNQKIPVEAKIDLHGMTLEKAHQALNRFLISAINNEARCIEIVTGKGNPEKGTGELRRSVPLWLENETINPFIMHIEENPASRGGSLMVLLRRNKVS